MLTLSQHCNQEKDTTYYFLAWVFLSLCVCLIKIRVSRTCLENRLYYAICITLFRAIIGIVLLLLSFFTRKIRNLHVKAIERRNSYFGIHKEKLDTLNILKKNVKETLKFNVATVLISLIQSLVAILHSLSSQENVFIISATLALLLFLKWSSLLAIILTHSTIRREIERLCCCGVTVTLKKRPNNWTRIKLFKKCQFQFWRKYHSINSCLKSSSNFYSTQKTLREKNEVSSWGCL